MSLYHCCTGQFSDKINKTWLGHLFSLLFEKALRKSPGAADKDGQNVTLPDIFPGVQWLNLPLTTEVSLWLSSQLLNESILFNYLGQSVLMSYNNISCFLWKLSTLKRKEHTVNVNSGREQFLNSIWVLNCYFFFIDIHVEYVSCWQGCAPASLKAPGTLFLILGN